MRDNDIDIVLWAAFKKGDREAFGHLFRGYYGLLVQYGSRFCPDDHLLEDCIQELFIELWQSRSDTAIQSLKAYLLKALKYKLLRQLKKGTLTKASIHFHDDLNFEVSHDHFIVAEEEKGQVSRKMIDAINKLTNRQKEIIYLKIYQGLHYEEISEVMGINYQASRNLFHQSIKSLREFFLPGC